jgi:hypothetical protein
MTLRAYSRSVPGSVSRQVTTVAAVLLSVRREHLAYDADSLNCADRAHAAEVVTADTPT